MLHDNDIIDIYTHDGAGHRTMRRVKVCNLRTRDGKYVIDGVNMQGGNPMRYHLPLQPVKGDVERLPGSTGWVPFDNEAEADE